MTSSINNKLCNKVAIISKQAENSLEPNNNNNKYLNLIQAITIILNSKDSSKFHTIALRFWTIKMNFLVKANIIFSLIQPLIDLLFSSNFQKAHRNLIIQIKMFSNNSITAEQHLKIMLKILIIK